MLSRVRPGGRHTASWLSPAFQARGFVLGIGEEALWWPGRLRALGHTDFFPRCWNCLPWLWPQRNQNGTHFLCGPWGAQLGSQEAHLEAFFSAFLKLWVWLFPWGYLGQSFPTMSVEGLAKSDWKIESSTKTKALFLFLMKKVWLVLQPQFIDLNELRQVKGWTGGSSVAALRQGLSFAVASVSKWGPPGETSVGLSEGWGEQGATIVIVHCLPT